MSSSSNQEDTRSTPAALPGDLPKDVDDFLSRQWEDPADTLKRLTTYLAESTFVAYDNALEDWLKANKSALEAAAVTDTNDLGPKDVVQSPHVKNNLEALAALKAEYEQRTQAESSEASRLDWQYDPGYRMLEERGSKIRTEAIDTVLLINGKVVGNPPKETLTKIIIPRREALDSLMFRAEYLVPDHNYSYITIHVSRWTQRWGSSTAKLTRFATIEIPMVKCQSVEPKIEALTKAAAAVLVGVDECVHMVAKYTITGAPRFSYTDCSTSFFDNAKINEQLASLVAELRGPSQVEISLLHAMGSDETEDPKLDKMYKTLEDCTKGWRRDRDNPLAVYFANSPSREMLDICTVPKGDNIPFVCPLPARAVFENPRHYNVTMAVGTQQEKEYQDRQNQKLTEIEVPVRLIADPQSLHPQSKSPQEYFVLIDMDSVGEKDHLLPRVGDSGDITLLGKDVNPFSSPMSLHGHRVGVSSPLWPATTQVWRVTVPVDKSTGSARLPLVLNIRDASLDDKGKLLTRKGFLELGKSGKASHDVRIKIIDSHKTYEAEMNALKKLSAPHMMPLDDRPSVTSLLLFDDLIKADLRDGKPLKELMSVLERLRTETYDNEKLKEKYRYLSKDKRKAIEFLLDDKKMLKYIHGPPGTGKSYLTLFLICVALLCDPPTGSNDERNLPVDAGRQLSPMEFDQVDQSAALRPVQLTDKQRAETPAPSQRMKILVTSGQNTAVDDLVPRLKTMWKEEGFEGLRPEPVILRMHSLEGESKDFPRRLVNLGRQIEWTKDEANDGILMRLLSEFSEKADEYEREGRKKRRPNPSIVDKAIELYHADRKAPQATRKYNDLAYLIMKVKNNAENYTTMRKQISTLVKDGPQKDAITLADVIFSTPVGASDRTFRTNFRPHFIFCDEISRDKEMSFNILVAHFTPLAFLTFGEHKQLRPIVFSMYQHLEHKALRSAPKKYVDMDEATGADASGGNDSEKPLPRPATFAPQHKKNTIHRLVEAGHPTYMLQGNHRTHGSAGGFFSEQFYNNGVRFKATRDSSNRADKATMNFLRILKGEKVQGGKVQRGKVQGNSLMIDMNSLETCVGRSFSNIAHVNYVLQFLVDLFWDPGFAPSKKRPNDGTVMIVTPYEQQRSLYNDELQKRAAKEFNSEGRYVEFDKSRIDVRTHHGAQGHEASFVIIDLVRHSGPGHTGHSDVVTICSSRSICGQVVLMNGGMIDSTDTNAAPNVRNLVAWQQYHKRDDMFIHLDTTTARNLEITCFRCHMYGHEGNQCGKKLVCPKPGCAGDHHLRDCDHD